MAPISFPDPAEAERIRHSRLMKRRRDDLIVAADQLREHNRRERERMALLAARNGGVNDGIRRGWRRGAKFGAVVGWIAGLVCTPAFILLGRWVGMSL
ncbi:MAG TPA: hypothetical protein VGP22_04555 [Albitalea sp.]|nr:hypothetical protein [Albitalea sp.]